MFFWLKKRSPSKKAVRAAKKRWPLAPPPPPDNTEERSQGKSQEPPQEEDSRILYTSDLLEGLALPKYQLCEAIETYLRAQIDEESLDAAVLLLYSLNPQSRLGPAIQVMQKYLNNVLSNPEEEKFRKIRTSNKVFQEKVAATNGAVDFLQAIGFAVQMIPNEQTGEQESYLVLDEPNVVLIQAALEELASGNAVTLKLLRDPKVFYVDPNKPIPAPQVPPEFFELSKEEIHAMQQKRIEDVEKPTTLRTRAMREADAAAGAGSHGGSAHYKYTLIRVLFPDNFILKGVFFVHESVLAIREFVSQRLELEPGEFSLYLPKGKRAAAEKSLLDYGLAPTATLHFQWDGPTMDYFNANNLHQTFLSSWIQTKLAFVCKDGDIIPVRSHFHKLSKFVSDYIANFFSEGAANYDPNASRITLSHIERRHVRIMFIFIEEWRTKEPAEFADCCADNENAVKKIHSIPTWAQTFIQRVPRDDVILCVNAANFLECHIVVKYFMMFLAKKLSACDSADEMREYLNETNDFSDNERAQSLHIAQNGGSWKTFVQAIMRRILRRKVPSDAMQHC